MNGGINKVIDRFKLAELPSLPGLLAAEIDLSNRPGAADALREVCAADIFLQAKILGLSTNRVNNGHRSAATAIATTPVMEIASLVEQTAVQAAFGKLDTLRTQFIKHFWRHSLLSGHIAESLATHAGVRRKQDEDLVSRAAFCGRFLNIGKLVLEQKFRDRYLTLLQQVGNGPELLQAEQAQLGMTHTDTGAALLAGWGVESFCCDALRYHHEDITQILDATSLVKILWLANRLAADADNPELGVYAETLFSLSLEETAGMRESALMQAEQLAGRFGIRFLSERYLPLEDNEDRDIVQADRKALAKLREYVQARAVFNAVNTGFLEPGKTAGPDSALGGAIHRLLGAYGHVLFAGDSAGGPLKSVAGSVDAFALSEITIACEEDRSCVAACYLGQETLHVPDSQTLTVIDRQLMTLLGSDNLSCLPLGEIRHGKTEKDGKPAGVLVLGIPARETATLEKRELICHALQQALARQLAATAADQATADHDAGSWESKIRETIHEVNNPLGIIKNYLQLLGMKLEDDAKIQSEINFIRSEIDRVSNILEGLRRGPDTQVGTLETSLNALVENIHRVFIASLPADSGIIIDLDLDTALPPLVCEENKLRQVVTNLVKNAAEAVTHGGRIRIKTSGNFYMSGQHFIQLCIKDDGPGIAAHILDNLFVPGHSTKGGGHTGSGLAIVKSLVDEMHGHVACATTPKGTEFTVLLPLDHSPANPLETQKNPRGTH